MQEKSTSLKLAQQRGTLKQIPIPRCEPECKTKQECIATHMLITHTPLVTSPFFYLILFLSPFLSAMLFEYQLE